MSNPNPLTEHLKETQFKPGESGNPAGKPLGAQNRSTLFKQWLSLPAEDGESGTKIDQIARKAIQEANAGNIQAINIIMDGVFGKVADKTELTGAGGGAIKSETTLPDSDRDIINRYMAEKAKQPKEPK